MSTRAHTCVFIYLAKNEIVSSTFVYVDKTEKLIHGWAIANPIIILLLLLLHPLLPQLVLVAPKTLTLAALSMSPFSRMCRRAVSYSFSGVTGGMRKDSNIIKHANNNKCICPTTTQPANNGNGQSLFSILTNHHHLPTFVARWLHQLLHSPQFIHSNKQPHVPSFSTVGQDMYAKEVGRTE